jgi:AcrR family transcriptional regulator
MSHAIATTDPTERDDHLKRQLVNAALELLGERGPDAVRIRDVAARAGCSTMGVYTRFGSKDGLFDELFRLGFRRLTDELAALVPSADPRANVVQLMLAYRRAALDNPALYGVMLERAMPDFTPSRAARIEALEPYHLLVEAVGRCPIASLDADTAAYFVWCTAHGLVSIELTHRRWGGPVMQHLRQGESEQTFCRAIETVLDGILRQE